MVQRPKGFRSKTRKKLKKEFRGLPKITEFLKEFKEGDKVLIRIEPSWHKGMPHPRFHGRTGIVIGRRGRCYIVAIKDLERVKQLIVHPVHLQKA